MVSEIPPARIIGLGLSVLRILLEIILQDRPDDFVDVLLGFKLTRTSEGRCSSHY